MGLLATAFFVTSFATWETEYEPTAKFYDGVKGLLGAGQIKRGIFKTLLYLTGNKR